MRKRKNTTAQQVREQATSIAQAIIEQATSRAMDGTERARSAATSASHRFPDFQKRGEDVVPSVREIAMQAASAAIELWQVAKERAEAAVEGAEHSIGDPAMEFVGHAEQRAKEVAHQMVSRADDVTERAFGATRDAASHVAGRADEVAERAKDATRSAAESTVSTGKDTAATLFWTAAAGGIIFYAMLDKDRRDQVMKFMHTVVTQSREIIRDFRGYDEKFA